MADQPQNAGSGAGEDFYSDSTPNASQDSAPKGDDGEDTDGVTAVVPKNLCPDMKQGDEMVVKILKVTDDSYVVGYAPEKGKEEGAESEPEPAPAPQGKGEMTSMME